MTNPESKSPTCRSSSEFKLKMPPWAKVQPRDFRDLLEKIRERPDAALLESCCCAQSLAVYAPDNIGHFGLALEAYAHFTSPIRRYSDLLVHRAIKHALAGGKPDTFTYSPHAMAAFVAAMFGTFASCRRGPREVDERIERRGWKTMSARSSTAHQRLHQLRAVVELDESKSTGWCTVTQPRQRFLPLRRGAQRP